MEAIETTFKSHDDTELICFEWECISPKAIVHIIHGMSEHSRRYNHFASWLNSKDIYVISSDLRGHGRTAGKIENVGFFQVKNGWDIVTKDIVNISEHYKKIHSQVPIIILGHSMGSFIARSIAIDYPNTANGYIFSATAGHPGLLGLVGNKLAKLNGKIFGKKNRSKLLDFLAFGDFNKKIKNNSTKKDWLSRDEKIVEKYINDPYCMQIFTAQFFVDLTGALLKINDTAQIQKMKKETPYLFFSGYMDPVGKYGKGVIEVVDKCKKLNFSNITCKLFEGGRHEMINETNKEEVYDFLYNWINKNTSN
ncbi:MAG: alpha/beta hydrolase [Crocinitomicaceae bacterium]|nr:alpha/beta hydrolase [Crocinitomicaceae bacterium]|tara:strand:- start:3276 stop:4202 length:927 start_codon:yes stop_codon:yes gene_type:complete